MLWLASFLRSGNTFFRNALYEVYGLPSSAYHRDPNRVLDPDYATYPIVKTHLLPEQLPEAYRHWPAVYLLRDGRDALVSVAHHRKDITAPGSNFYLNLLQAIVAPGGSHFGGWSRNVDAWTARGALVIRFSDLVRQPLVELERLRALIELPPARPDKLPTFQQLKFGQPKYQATAAVVHGNQKHFRKGRVGGWKEEMPPELQALFWFLHGDTMRAHGFTAGELAEVHTAAMRESIWTEIQRHLEHIGPSLTPAEQAAALDILVAVRQRLQQHNTTRTNLDHLPYERYLRRLKAGLRSALPHAIYQNLAKLYRQLPLRRWLGKLRRLIVVRKSLR